MMFDHPTGTTPWHPMGCQCDTCEPDSPADAGEGTIVGPICLLVAAGMAAAVPIAAIIDALTTRVGLLSIFGS